jgi:hypothetical protein
MFIKREPGGKIRRVAPSQRTRRVTKAPPQPELVAGVLDHDMLKSAADSVSKNTDREPEQGLLAVQENSDAAMRHAKESEVDPLPVRKRHGGALPS